MLQLFDLRIDHNPAPNLAPTHGLRFSWKMRSERENVTQKTFRVTICKENEIVFDSETVESEQSCDISFEELFLQPATEYVWNLCVKDNFDRTAITSLQFSTELYADMWQAQWITPAENIPSWSPYLRKKFEAKQGVRRAVLYACGLGCAEYYINGKKIADDYIDPPMTNYEKEVLYRAYDVTGFLAENNAIVAWLGEGFYAQSQVWAHDGFSYGNVCLIARLEIEYQDGTRDAIVTDTTWQSKKSPIVLNNIYGGETYDARLETPDFALADGNDVGWTDCVVDSTPKGELKPCNMPPVRIIKRIPAKSVTPCCGKSDGAWIYDLGENFAGVAEFHIPWSSKGHIYVFRFAETLNEAGQLDFRSTGSFATQCVQQEIYIAKGDAQGEVWRPRFTYHGFRYVEVTGPDYCYEYGKMPELDLVVGCALSTDLEQNGTFESSSDDLNLLHELICRTFRSNYHGLPEDCPAREKCGWLGDAQIVCNTGIMNYNMTASYEKYLSDIRTQKEVYGTWTMIAPGKRGCGEASPLWGCAQIIIPYWLYHYCNDTAAVTRNWDLMQAWVEHELARAEDYIISVGLGDWCPPCGESSPRRIPVPHSSTLMFYEICIKMAELSSQFGYGNAAYYTELADRICESFIRHFYDHDKHTYGTWASDAVALTLGVYPEYDREALLASLRDCIIADDYAMSTGIYGNKYLIPLLFEEGMGDAAMEILFNRRHTSFGTMMDDGATSVWEVLEMHRIERDTGKPVSSYNHPMHAGFAYIYYAYLGGIQPAEPGFKTFVIKPYHVSGVDHVAVTYECQYGTIEVCADKTVTGYAYTVKVPANTHAVLSFAEGVKITSDQGFEQICSEDDTCYVGSGIYRAVSL